MKNQINLHERIAIQGKILQLQCVPNSTANNRNTVKNLLYLKNDVQYIWMESYKIEKGKIK